jgi:hypothetical protein
MCDCGCNTCDTKKPVMLNESVAPRAILSEGLKYHLDNARPLTEHVYRAGSESYFNLWAEARALYSRNIIEVQGDDLEILTETDLGHFGCIRGSKSSFRFYLRGGRSKRGRQEKEKSSNWQTKTWWLQKILCLRKKTRWRN